MELKTSNKFRFFVRVSKKIKNDLSFIENNENSAIKQKCSVKKACYKESMVACEETFNPRINLVKDKDTPTFSKLVKEHMDKKGITTKDIYKNSLINRKLFSALNVNDDYIPSRETAIMYCLALKLNYEESTLLMKSAGYSFYEYSNFDIIIKYFIDNKIYNIDKINDSLYYYTKKCLGYR